MPGQGELGSHDRDCELRGVAATRFRTMDFHPHGGMLERKTVKYKFKLTAVALANKVARIVFALMTRGGQYDNPPVAA